MFSVPYLRTPAPVVLSILAHGVIQVLFVFKINILPYPGAVMPCIFDVALLSTMALLALVD